MTCFKIILNCLKCNQFLKGCISLIVKVPGQLIYNEYSSDVDDDKDDKEDSKCIFLVLMTFGMFQSVATPPCEQRPRKSSNLHSLKFWFHQLLTRRRRCKENVKNVKKERNRKHLQSPVSGYGDQRSSLTDQRGGRKEMGRMCVFVFNQYYLFPILGHSQRTGR